VKNVFGCIPGLRKAEYHKAAPNPRDFGNILADIHEAAKIGLHIMDGITAMEGEGPTAGDVYFARKILISKDPLALDIIALQMLGLDIKDIPILQAAIERKLGQSDKDRIEVCGDFLKPPLLQNYKIPKRFTSKKKSNYNSLIKVIDFLKTEPKINLKKCLKCNTCVDSCPMYAIDKITKKINYSKCIECMCCHELCQYNAVELRRVNPAANIMTKLYRGNYK
jgi:ferredoxin